MPQFSRRLRRTLYTGRFVLTFPFRPVTGPARSLARLAYLFRRLLLRAHYESQSINKLRRMLCLYAGSASARRFLHHHRSHPFFRLFICPACARLPRRVSPIGITRDDGASKRERKHDGDGAIASRKAKLPDGFRGISRRAPRSTWIEDFANVANE